jgi:hypothetical protein
VSVENGSDAIAFFVRLRLIAGPGGRDVTPVMWSDGYITLMPGEGQRLTASYDIADLHGMEPSLQISGWNVPRSTPPVSPCD